MAKIISSVKIDETAIFFTSNRPTEGTKILFLSTEAANGILTGYDKNEDGAAVYANGIRCILCDEVGLRPYVIPVNDFMAQSTALINNKFTPQDSHTITKRIRTFGTPALQELGNACAVAVVGATYPMKVKKFTSDDTYNWTTLGVDETKDTYKLKDGVITYDKKTITLEECAKFFEEHQKRQNDRLNQ